jgi:hypothetical protein
MLAAKFLIHVSPCPSVMLRRSPAMLSRIAAWRTLTRELQISQKREVLAGQNSARLLESSEGPRRRGKARPPPPVTMA